MSVNINADTTNGLVLTSDTTGEIKLQSAGTDIATVNSSGITMASGKTLPAASLTGTMPSGSLPTLKTVNGSSIVGSGDIEVGGGKILQAVTSTKTNTFSTTSTGFVDVTGLSLSITPSASDSKILVMFSIAFHGSHSGSGHIRFMRGSTMMVSHTASAGSRAVSHASAYNINQESNSTPVSFTFLDSPATTNAVTYKPQIRSGNGYTQYINRTSFDGNNANYGRYSSTIIAMEVSA